MTKFFINPTEEAGRKLFSNKISSPVVMLNLLRFRQFADYSSHPKIAPKDKISGRSAFDLYINHSKKFLEATGGEVLLIGDANEFFIGPKDETWDLVMLIRQRSLTDFLSFATNQEYLAGIGHREAALMDSRLLPIFEQKGPSQGF